VNVFNELVVVHVTAEHMIVSVRRDREQVAVLLSHEAALMLTTPGLFGAQGKVRADPHATGPYHLEEHGVNFFLQPLARMRVDAETWVVVTIELLSALAQDLSSILALSPNRSFVALACRGGWSHQGVGTSPTRIAAHLPDSRLV